MTCSNGTFIIQIKSREHETCQGVIRFVEQNEKIAFRSTLELMKLIDSAARSDEEA